MKVAAMVEEVEEEGEVRMVVTYMLQLLLLFLHHKLVTEPLNLGHKGEGVGHGGGGEGGGGGGDGGHLDAPASAVLLLLFLHHQLVTEPLDLGHKSEGGGHGGGGGGGGGGRGVDGGHLDAPAPAPLPPPPSRYGAPRPGTQG